MQLLFVFLVFLALHIIIWFSTNLQLMPGFDQKKALIYCIILAIPTSSLAFYATKISYEYFNSAWSARLMGHGTSYLVFPLLTWILLSESPFNTKTVICICLSLTIVLVQIFYPS